MKYEDDYVCTLSGVTALDHEEVEDEEDDLPVGWFKVSVVKRELNPEWVFHQEFKQAKINGVLEQIEEKHRNEAKPMIEHDISAQYAAYDQSLTKYVDLEDTVYIAPDTRSNAIKTEIVTLFTNLDIDPAYFNILADAQPETPKESVEQVEEKSESVPEELTV